MTLRIRFHPSVDPPPELEPFPVRALASMLVDEGVPDDGEIHCVLVGDSEIAELNERFRGREGPTDVLAFPYDPAQTEGVRGDVYVSLDRAVAQAAERDEEPAREAWRLFVHGALHLAGHDHETDTDDRAMRRVQETWVERVFPGPT